MISYQYLHYSKPLPIKLIEQYNLKHFNEVPGGNHYTIYGEYDDLYRFIENEYDCPEVTRKAHLATIRKQPPILELSKFYLEGEVL